MTYRRGDKVRVGRGDVVTTATFGSFIGNGGGRANVFVRLDGTDELVTLPWEWLLGHVDEGSEK